MHDPGFYITGIDFPVTDNSSFNVLQHFFSCLPGNMNMAFVLLHQAPGEVIKRILSKYTALHIEQVKASCTLYPGVLYLAEASQKVMFSEQYQLITGQESPQALSTQELFFYSLAATAGARASAVVLDRTALAQTGLRLLEQQGGMILALRDTQGPYTAIQKLDFFAKQQTPADIEREYTHTQQVLRSAAAFSLLTPDAFPWSWLQQRIGQRMLRHNTSLEEYARLISADISEAGLLLPGCSAAFIYQLVQLKNRLFSQLPVSGSPPQPLRLWLPVCTAREEAYVMAVLLEEYAKKLGHPLHYKIFAGSRRPDLLEQTADPLLFKLLFSAEWLDTYFTAGQQGYDLQPALLEKISFVQHNPISDPPFMRLHVIMAGDWLSRLDTPLKRKVLANFSYALEKEGILCVPMSCQIQDYFEETNYHRQFFKKPAVLREALGRLLQQLLEKKELISQAQQTELLEKQVRQLKEEKRQLLEKLGNLQQQISFLKGMEMELQQKNQKLLQNNEYLDNFVFALAHDLQAPVVHLNYAMNLLQEGMMHSSDTQEYMQVMHNAIYVLERTLNELVNLIRIQSTEEQARLLVFDEFVQRIAGEMSKEHSDYELEADFSSCPAIFYVEPYLNSILRNLFSNAIKYRDEERPLCIRIRTECRDPFVLLSFEDNGVGMDLKKIGREMFKPFRRFSARAGGAGIGLHTIKYMIEKNGGSIEVSSQPNQGSTFYVFLREYL